MIFKAEFFKYLQDKKYIGVTISLAVLNVLATIYFTYLIDHMTQSGNQMETIFNGVLVTFFIMCLFANIIFMFFYPFHLLAMDYKNDVMPLLLASGVNRRKLFFSKLGATFIWVIGITTILILIPGLIILFRLSQEASLSVLYANIIDTIRAENLSLIGLVFSFLLNYLNTLVLISLTTIMLKGRNLAILVYFGLYMCQSLILGFLQLIPIQLQFTQTGQFLLSSLALFFMTIIGVIVALMSMKRQNL